MSKLIPIICLSIACLMTSSCNPKCEDILGIPVTMNVKKVTAGMEVLMQTREAEYLHTLGIYARNSAADEPVPLQSEVMSESLLKVTMPENKNGMMELVVKDRDCGGFLALSNLESQDAAFFKNNPGFVTPILPQIIIPSITTANTIDITNAWISPQDRSYCLWFGDFQDTYRANPDGTPIDGDPGTEKVDTIFFKSKFLDEKSIELAIGACTEDIENSLFHENPVSGVVDFDNNFIQIFIDRTKKPGVERVEEYTGAFIRTSDVPLQEYLIGGVCQPAPGNLPDRKHLMVLTSKFTGHQLLLYKLDQ